MQSACAARRVNRSPLAIIHVNFAFPQEVPEMMVKTMPQQNKERKRLWTFAIVFKSSKNLLTEVEDFIFSRGGLVIYKTGPTSCHLFVIKANGKPEEGQQDAGGKK
jgi:hypothetical protein